MARMLAGNISDQEVRFCYGRTAISRSDHPPINLDMRAILNIRASHILIKYSSISDVWWSNIRVCWSTIHIFPKGTFDCCNARIVVPSGTWTILVVTTAYFGSFKNQIHRRKRWKVRRFIVISKKATRIVYKGRSRWEDTACKHPLS